MTQIDPANFRIALEKNANKAEWMHERVIKSIIEFEEKLDPSQELSARLVNFSAEETISIEDVGYWGPDIIKFYGRNSKGDPVELIQHMSQLSVLLVAVQVEKGSAKRIGFTLSRYLDSSD